MMNFLYYDNGGWLWGLWVATGVAMLVFWGILSWAVVSIIRRKEAHGDGGSEASPRQGHVLTEGSTDTLFRVTGAPRGGGALDARHRHLRGLSHRIPGHHRMGGLIHEGDRAA